MAALPIIITLAAVTIMMVLARRRRWLWLVLATVFGVFAVLRLVIPAYNFTATAGPAAFFFAISMACLARYWKKPPPVDPTVKEEWTDADKEDFKRLMDRGR